VVASHALFVGNAAERLCQLPIETIFISDSVPAPERFPCTPGHIVGFALAETIQRLYHPEPLGDVLAKE
jgi:phosphoribosylpyrophosphate synthetase